jgi:hypothetical protein
VCPVTSRRMSDDEGATFRDAVLGGTTMNLYRLNKVHHQVRLLALVSGDLDCVFLQLREARAVRLVGRGASA